MVLEPEVLAARIDGDRVNLRLRVPPRLAHFEGHFPGAPVLPGVVQIDWAMRLAQRYFGRPLASGGMDQLKFLAIVRPADELALSLRLTADCLRFEYRRGERVVSSATMLLAAAP